MTRREQINLYLKERNIPITSLEANSIIEGIKWADEHPYLSEEEQVGISNLGITWQKQALIKKACEWLNENAKSYTINGGLFIKRLICSFKKAMEE